MAKLVALGERAFVLALVGIGAEPVQCKGVKEFAEALRRVALQRGTRIVFVPEPMVAAVPEAIESFRRRSQAALLALPLVPSEDHPSMKEVRHLIEQATGATLI